MNNEKDIRALSAARRIAGYLARSARHAEYGAKLRDSGREDETWGHEEQAAFDAMDDDMEPWWNAMSEEEREAIIQVEFLLAALCRGESPTIPVER